MKKILLIILSVILLIVVISCMTPMPMTMPPPPPDMPKPAPMPDENKQLKKMCVGHDCRKMGAVDGGGTTRGYSNDKDD